MHLSGRVSRVDRTRIVSGGSWEQLEKFLSSNHFLNGRIFILTDRTTKVYCLPVLLSRLPCLEKAEILEIPAGEESKTLKQAELLWQQLFEAQADRSALLINLGGGMTSDLGGFIAAGFMRGIPYINLPTSLMGQVDASIGGKTAVNLLGVKNQLGFFYSPIAVFVFAEFLQSLSKEQLRSGFAEILKTALILDTSLYRIVLRQSIQQWMEIPVTDKRWVEIINRTICIKNKVVKSDFLEKKQRKILNFGHTFGHALESLSCQQGDTPLLHGEAVALGMICETFLSSFKTGLLKSDRERINSYIREGFQSKFMNADDFSLLMKFMHHDKKNRKGRIRFTLLEEPGKALINVACTAEEILDAYQRFVNREC